MQAELTPEIKSFLDSKYWNSFLSAELAKGLELELAVMAAAKAIQGHSKDFQNRIFNNMPWGRDFGRGSEFRKAVVRDLAKEIYNSVRTQ